MRFVRIALLAAALLPTADIADANASVVIAPAEDIGQASQSDCCEVGCPCACICSCCPGARISNGPLQLVGATEPGATFIARTAAMIPEDATIELNPKPPRP